MYLVTAPTGPPPRPPPLCLCTTSNEQQGKLEVMDPLETFTFSLLLLLLLSRSSELLRTSTIMSFGPSVRRLYNVTGLLAFFLAFCFLLSAATTTTAAPVPTNHTHTPSPGMLRLWHVKLAGLAWAAAGVSQSIHPSPPLIVHASHAHTYALSFFPSLSSTFVCARAREICTTTSAAHLSVVHNERRKRKRGKKDKKRKFVSLVLK
ncbi:hypothetical protein IWX91DRAFT_54315 [Phyllosticta citricarpa]